MRCVSCVPSRATNPAIKTMSCCSARQPKAGNKVSLFGETIKSWQQYLAVRRDQQHLARISCCSARRPGGNENNSIAAADQIADGEDAKFWWPYKRPHTCAQCRGTYILHNSWPDVIVILAENGLADGLAGPRDSPTDCSFVARYLGLRERGHDTAARIEQSTKSHILQT